MKRFLVLLIFSTILFSSMTAIVEAQFGFPENPLVGKQAPDFTLKILNGQEASLNQIRGNEGSILLFWATWCPHCRSAVENLSRMSGELNEKGVKVLLVDLAEDPQTVKSYVQRNKINFEVFLDEDNFVAEEYGVIGVPTFFLVNKEGVIKDVGHALPRNYHQLLQ